MRSLGNVDADAYLLDALEMSILEIDEGFKSPRRAAEISHEKWGFTDFSHVMTVPLQAQLLKTSYEIASHKEKIMWRIKDTLTDIAIEEAGRNYPKNMSSIGRSSVILTTSRKSSETNKSSVDPWSERRHPQQNTG